MKRPALIMPALIMAALLPLAGLGAVWAWSDHRSRQGTQWDVPITGYDPRDILRGHYVEFTYDWPGLDGADRFMLIERLCLAGNPPAINRAEIIADEAALAACAHPVIAQAGGVYGAEGLRRGRIYLGQTRARELDAALRQPAQRAVIRIRQRPDGSFTAIDIRLGPQTSAQRPPRP
ncbi:MAG: GDYXXLXY domain-containing protein [Erythrobacter sp.]